MLELQFARGQIGQQAPFAEPERNRSGKRGDEVDRRGGQIGFKRQVKVGVDATRRRRDVQHGGHRAGQAGGLQHHHHLVAVSRQRAPHGAGQHDAQHHLEAAHAISLGGFNFTRAGLPNGAGQHLGGVARRVQAEGQQGAKERFLEMRPRPHRVPARLNPLQLAQAVVDQIDLDQQRRAAHHVGVSLHDPAQRRPRVRSGPAHTAAPARRPPPVTKIAGLV